MSKHGAMNRIYRVVWNAALGVWQAVSEFGKGRKKTKTRKVCIATPELAGLLKHLHPVRIGLMLGSLLLVSPSVYAAALPQNGVVTSGVGSINQPNANTLNITQTTDKMAIDWQSFSVGQGNTVNFIQPSTSAIALNRVIGNDVSQIQGAINANGQVFLINPNGVLFSTTAQVNVGSLVASTRNITNEQFNAGDYRFEGHSSSAIINQGNIKVADGGYVVMIAAKIDNSGSIRANQGTVAMAAGNLVTLDMGGPVKLKVEQGHIDALIKNGGAIQAEGGHILLTAKAAGDLAASVINNSGKIEASSISEVGGQIVLLGDDITNSGTLAANGASGGGEILIGGDWQGSNADIYPHATNVTLTETSVVSADATENGDGGKVVAWSDISNAASLTSVSGTISAKGGENGGDGGQIETSGALLITEGVTGSAAAPMGKAGEWLFDPTNVTIGTSGTASAQNNGTTISASSIASLLNGGTSVTVTTSSGGSELGDLTVNNTITKSSGDNDVTLTLRAANSIVINQTIENSGGNGKLHLVIDADNNTAASTAGSSPVRDGGGITILEANLSTGGGNVTFGGTAAGTGGIYTGGDLFVGGSSAVSITTNGGSVDVKGNLIIANSSSEGFAISTNGGAIDLRKAVDSGNQYTAVSGAERTWQQARDHAKAQGGWLATIGSSLENALAIRAAGYSDAWLGGQRIIGTNEWRWTQDPAYNATSNPMVFFYQGTSSQTSLGGTASGSGGTTATGYFANWNGWTNGSTPASEPNNWNGHYPGVFSEDRESALQFTGNRGLWNDLPTNYTLNQYVRETNLAPSRLQLNAGSGAVNIGGAVGSSKALSQLNVTSSNTSVTGNSIITTGGQTYSSGLNVNNAGSIEVSGSSVTFNGDFSVKATGDSDATHDVFLNGAFVNNANSPASFDIQTPRHIKLGNNFSLSSSNAALNTSLWADTDSSADGIIYFEGSGINTNGGSLTFGKANQTKSIGGQNVLVGGDVFFQRNTAQTLTTTGGEVNIYGETIVANTSGLTINSGNGDVTLHGLLNSGNAYTFVDKTNDTAHDWNWARDNAKNGTAGGSAVGDSYLVTITSRLENAIAGLTAGYKGAWIGALRYPTNQYNWTWIDGPEAGQVFFTQNDGGGGTTAAGFYSNFGGGEPNGGLSAEASSVENVGQFFGSQGLWNDLKYTTQFSATQSSQYSVLGYVRETNLGGSAVAINAGTGDVTINGGVGNTKALSSLAVTSASTTVNGTSLVTTGGQTYSGSLTVNNASSTSPVTLQGAGITAGEVAVYGGTIKVNSNITTSANNGNILLQGQTSIESDSPTRALTSGSGNITLLTNHLVHTNSNKLNLTTTGVLTFAPYGAAWTNYGETLNFAGSFSGQNFTGSGDAGGLNINNFSSLGGLTLGKAGTTTGIAIDSALSLAGPISLIGGDLSLNKAVTTSDTLSLTSSTNISQSNAQADALSANSVVLLGGNVTLNNPYNNANTLAASGVSGLAYRDANALTIGTVGSTNGISATGVVSVATQTGDLTLAQNITTTDTTVSALTLNAGANEAAGTTTGGNILISGSPVISLGVNGVARLFSASVSGSTGLTELIGESSGRFRYNSDESKANYSRSLLAGLNAIYREAIAVDISGMALSMTYGEALPSISATGTVNGDGSVYAITGRVNSKSGHIKASETNYVINEGLSALGYSVTGTTSGTLTVNTKALTVDGLTIADKTYNGNAEASTSAAGSLAGLVTGDDVTFSTAASFNSKDVEATKTVNLDHTLAGADAENYSLADQTNVATDAKINAKALTLSASKTYDGSADLTGFVTLTGFVGSETLAYSGATASDKHVATADKYINAITLADGGNGGLASNYQLPTLNATNAAVTINPATLTPTLTNTGVTKVYDGTTKAPVSGTPTWSFAGLVAGDSAATLNYTDAAYNSKDVDAANAITVSGLTIDSISGTNGSYASDYVLDADIKTVAATITPAALTVIANNDARFFSQTDTEDYAGTSFTGFVNGETTDVLDLAGLKISRSDGSNNAAGTYTLSASGATAKQGNYTIAYQNGTYTIVPAGQLLVKVRNVSQAYGNAVDFSIGSAAYLASDNSTINTVTFTDNGNDFTGDGVTFEIAASGSSNSTAGKINVGNYQLTGSVTAGNSSNFSNNLVVVGALDVTQKPITASATGVSKVYDGTTAMSGVTLGLSTLETNDVVTVNGMGAFSSKNVGSNLSYTVSNLALTGTDAANY
jgi:filamentous hemagglutinin family protein